MRVHELIELLQNIGSHDAEIAAYINNGIKAIYIHQPEIRIDDSVEKRICLTITEEGNYE